MALRKTSVFTPLTQYLADFTDVGITTKTLLEAQSHPPLNLPANEDGWECRLTQDPDGKVNLLLTNRKWGGTYEVTVRLPKRDGKLIQPPPFPVRKRKL